MRELPAVVGVELERDDVARLELLRRDAQRPKAGPRGRRAGRGQPDVPATRRAPLRIVEQCAQRCSPARAQRGHAQRALEQVRVARVEIQQPVDRRHGDLFRTGGDLDDFVARLHLAFFDHPEVEARSASAREQRGHARLVHADADAVAGHARLCDFEDRRTDPVAVADADLVVGEPVDREVLAELAVHEVVAVQLLAPVVVRTQLVHVDRALLAAVTGEVALPVAVEVQAADDARAFDRLLPNAGVHRAALPLDVTRHPDVDRDQCGDGGRHQSELTRPRA